MQNIQPCLVYQLFTAIRDKSKEFQFGSESKVIKLQLKSSRSSNKHYRPSSIMCFIAMHKQNMVFLTAML